MCELQSYIRRIGDCLIEAGQEMVGPGALRLQPLRSEFCCLHVIKARTSPQEWRALLKGAIVSEGILPLADLDWAELLVRNSALTALPQCTSTESLACNCIDV